MTEDARKDREEEAEKGLAETVVEVVEEESDDIFEMAKAMALAAVVALSIRTFLFEPFNIPSGSMLPTLLVGDYLFVEKYAYGYSRYAFPMNLAQFEGRILPRMPARGDVAVFRQPRHTHVDYIKRIIGLPGDTVQVTGGVLHINGKPVLREYRGSENYRDDSTHNVVQRYAETLPGGVTHAIYELSDMERLDDTVAYTVPEGHFFAMGDNRDKSQDSRVMHEVGFVPMENLVGRAFVIFFSTEGLSRSCARDGALAGLRSLGCKLVSWPMAIRYSRMLNRVSKL